MNLTKLFEMQKKLDERIIEEKGLEGQELWKMKLMALQVELAELAQEIGDVWKFWKEPKNREDRDMDRVLEELVDCLHFLLSLGIEAGVKPEEPRGMLESLNLFEQLDACFRSFRICYVANQWEVAFSYFLGLAEMLAFSWEDVEAAYICKNEINHHRQASGY